MFGDKNFNLFVEDSFRNRGFNALVEDTEEGTTTILQGPPTVDRFVLTLSHFGAHHFLGFFDSTEEVKQHVAERYEVFVEFEKYEGEQNDKHDAELVFVSALAHGEGYFQIWRCTK